MPFFCTTRHITSWIVKLDPYHHRIITIVELWHAWFQLLLMLVHHCFYFCPNLFIFGAVGSEKQSKSWFDEAKQDRGELRHAMVSNKHQFCQWLKGEQIFHSYIQFVFLNIAWYYIMAWYYIIQMNKSVLMFHVPYYNVCSWYIL